MEDVRGLVRIESNPILAALAKKPEQIAILAQIDRSEFTAHQPELYSQLGQTVVIGELSA